MVQLQVVVITITLQNWVRVVGTLQECLGDSMMELQRLMISIPIQ